MGGPVEMKTDGKGQVQEASALQMFKQMDLKGKSNKDDTVLSTTHQNTISTVREYEGSGDSVRKFSTSGVDGRVVVWTV